MGVMYNSTIDILNETSKLMIPGTETATDREAEELINSLDSMDEDFEYSEEAVPIMAIGEEYFMEFDEVMKYMDSNNVIDIAEAVANICKANKIDSANAYIVTESKKKMLDAIKDAPKDLKKNVARNIKALKSKVKVKAKKNKKK